jgi:ATP-dependent protease ClpP protease subunit
MKRIEIRGIIVPSSLDMAWAKDYIDKGLLTPESRVRKALAEAGDDVDLYINSQGGSVFSGNELVNALKQFKATGKKLEITVGAMAASMAANIIAMSGADKVRAHSNSKIMFHGASTITWAGSEAHADTAGLLASINSDVIASLTALPKADKNQITGWFAEGREGWLSAKQALDMGLISEIIDSPAAGLVEIPKAEADKLLEGGLDVAAFAFSEPQAGTPPAPPAGTPPAGFVAVSELEALTARLAGLQSAKDKEIAALKTEHATALKAKDDALAAATASITDFEAKLATATADLGKVTASLSAEVTAHATTKATLATTGEQLTAAKAQHKALVGGVLGVPPEGQKPSDKTGMARMIAAEKAETEKGKA